MERRQTNHKQNRCHQQNIRQYIIPENLRLRGIESINVDIAQTGGSAVQHKHSDRKQQKEKQRKLQISSGCGLNFLIVSVLIHQEIIAEKQSQHSGKQNGKMAGGNNHHKRRNAAGTQRIIGIRRAVFVQKPFAGQEEPRQCQKHRTKLEQRRISVVLPIFGKASAVKKEQSQQARNNKKEL